MVPSVKLTSTSSAPSMTWLLVTTSAVRIDDEAGAERVDLLARESRCRSDRRRTGRRNPGRASPPAASAGRRCCRVDTVCEEDMLTTASSSFAARSATEAGPVGCSAIGLCTLGGGDLSAMPGAGRGCGSGPCANAGEAARPASTAAATSRRTLGGTAWRHVGYVSLNGLLPKASGKDRAEIEGNPIIFPRSGGAESRLRH